MNKIKLNVDDNPLSKILSSENESISQEPPQPPIGNNVSNRSSLSQSLTIRQGDEARIVAAMDNAAKRQMTGAIFSVRIDISKTKTLGIGVKDLPNNLLTVSMLKRSGGELGAAESAGIRLGDIVFGINFIPLRDGSKTLLKILKQEEENKKTILHVQCWRCHQLCSDPMPGSTFPSADDALVQGHSLYRTKVFSDWERWNFIEIMLGHLVEELKIKSEQSETSESNPRSSAILKQVKAKQMRILDLERNILQAKGLRTALCVRIVHTKTLGEYVVYVLRVEDVETGLQWVVHRRYRDFFTLKEELDDMSLFTKDINFPKKTISMSLSRNTTRIVESRIIELEQYVRRVLHILTLHATMDPLASRSLRHLQNFLGVDKYVDCIRPPLLDDQRYIELMAYRFLNDFASPACQQCIRFVTSVDLEVLVSDTGSTGYRPVLDHMKQALTEVEVFVLQQHQQLMIHSLLDRKPELTPEQFHTFVRRCVRRQVEAALFLPLRRNVFRIVYSFIADQAQNMQDALSILQDAGPEYFMVDPYVTQTKSLPKAIKAFRDVMQAYLPADQGQLLMHAAAIVMELHTECIQAAKLRKELVTTSSDAINTQSSIIKKKIENTTDEASNHSTDVLECFINELTDSVVTETSPINNKSRRESGRFNLTGKAALRDPVSEMFSSEETSAPENVARGEAIDRLSSISMKDNISNEEEHKDMRSQQSRRKSDGILSMMLNRSNEELDDGELSIELNNLAINSSLNSKTIHQRNEIDNSNIIPSKQLSDDYDGEDIDQFHTVLDSSDIEHEGAINNSGFYEGSAQHTVVSADDFLPMFTYVLVQADLPQLLLVKEMMTNLVDDEETFGECGYYLATLEASTHHICDLARQYQEGRLSYSRLKQHSISLDDDSDNVEDAELS